VRSAATRNRRRTDEDEQFDRPAGRRPWWWRILLRRPTDSVAVLVVVASATAIIVNAAYLQHGRHPAPMFALRPLPVAAAAPAPDIVGVIARPREPAAEERHEGAPAHGHAEPAERGRSISAVAPPAAAPHRDPIAELLAAHQAPAQAQPVPTQAPARQAVLAPPRHADTPMRPSRQVLAVQRALSEFGYGQIKPTGVFDAGTRLAIQRFERDHNLPVNGEISNDVKRELATLTGHPID
jgi:Putative peptidoglycan binding domain